MTAFTVWKYDDPDSAGRAAGVLKEAELDGLVTVVDHAVVSWPVGADQPHTSHQHDSPKRGAGLGALWGLLGGALLMVPVAGVVVGAGIGALAKATDGTGITKEDMERIRTELGPGTSALFVVTEDADFDRLAERFRGRESTLIHTNLTEAERATLLESFGSE